MEKFLYVFIHLGLPTVIVIDFFYRKSKSRLGLAIKCLLYIAILFFLYIWGQYPLVISYYLRYLLLAAIIVILFLSFKRFKNLTKGLPTSLIGKILTVITGLLAIWILNITFNAIKGQSYPDEGIELTFPLRNGTFYIASGGSKRIINNHMRDYPNAQKFALDINKLGKYGSASKNMLSNNINDHFIFSDTVYCPCNGKIIDLKTDVKDNDSGSMNVDEDDGTGNFVNILCDQDVYVFLPHFKHNSVLVTKDMDVTVGTPLGLVGISGFSQEPHLHIQAARYTSDSVLVGIPMKFNSQKLHRNELFKVY